eukprot:5930655-Prymnesium_polylepis.1
MTPVAVSHPPLPRVVRGRGGGVNKRREQRHGVKQARSALLRLHNGAGRGRPGRAAASEQLLT